MSCQAVGRRTDRMPRLRSKSSCWLWPCRRNDGIRHPFVKNYVLARTTPLTKQRKTLPSFDQTFTKLRANLEAFDVARVRYEDVQRSAVFAAPAGE